MPEQANGKGLHEGFVPGVGPALFPAAHSAGPNDDKGLVQACESHRANGNQVVEFIPPGGAADCEHGPP